MARNAPTFNAALTALWPGLQLLREPSRLHRLHFFAPGALQNLSGVGKQQQDNGVLQDDAAFIAKVQRLEGLGFPRQQVIAILS